MGRPTSVVNLDPIERQKKRDNALIPRLLKTRPHGGKPVLKTAEIGHYLFAGKQRSGKTVSAIWYSEQLIKKWVRKKCTIKLYTNLGFGEEVTKDNLVPTILSIEYDPKIVHIIIVDEIHTYFPKDGADKPTQALADKLNQCLSQIAKKQIYVLSTAQIYGSVNKKIREQCLYMVNCRRSRINRKVVNEFIDGDDIMCDELGRWSGSPKVIHTHGLPKQKFDTHRMIVK